MIYLEIKVGRSTINSIVIDDNAISREHAVFKINEDSIVLEDLNSTNGTFVNGRKVKISRVTSKDIIKFGNNHNFDFQILENLISQPHRKVINNLSEQKQNKYTIGRDPSNHIVIDNIRISRKHGVVTKINDIWYIEDLNSLNGIYVNGKKIKRTPVSFSDRLSIGGIIISLSDIVEKRIHSEKELLLSCNSISYDIEGKKIIDNVSFTIHPGEFVGLIGESGSGKTTLLTLLNGYIKPSSGEILLNSIDFIENFNEFKGLSGYVPQEDIIHKELKVIESLKYSAELRFDGGLNNNEIEHQVNKILTLLNLVDSQNTIIGNAEKKGISGGQRKRVNLGQELISDPTILFLDEPTSGLDPRSDREVMELLKKFADKGKIIILTTHNISSDNFNIFSHLIVMSKGGKLAYFGESDKVCNYFGVENPINIFDKLKEKDSNYWQQKYKSSEEFKEYVIKRKKAKLEIVKRASKNNKIDTNFSFSQFLTLFKRNIIIKYRDTTSTLILLLQAPIIAILISFVFSRPDQLTEAIFVIVIASIWLGCSNSVRDIVSEQSIFKRERKVGLNLNSYLLSKYAVLSAICLIQSFFLIFIVSIFINIESPSYLFLITFLTSISSLSLGLFISSISKTNETAIALIPILLIPEVVLGGLISIFARMPEYVKLISGLMISRWSFESALISQFGNNYQVSAIGFEPSNLMFDLIIITLFGIVFFIATTLILKSKDKIF